MSANRSRPVNLNLLTIRFPIPAIVSILHRITGVLLFVLIPALLWLFSYSLTLNGFDQIQLILNHGFVRFVIWLCLIPFCFHLVAGIRHLLADIHIGDDLPAGRYTAVSTFVVTSIFVIGLGIWLW